MSQSSEPAFQLACPVCSAFNPADFRYCPHCGHRLGAPDLVQEPLTARRLFNRLFRPLLVILLLLLVIEMGLDSSLPPRLTPWLSRWWPALSPTPSTPVRETGTDVADRPALAPEPSQEAEMPGTTRPLTEASKAPGTTRQSTTALAELTLFDREGDLLRKVRGIVTNQERRLVTTLQSIHGAYRGTVRLPNQAAVAVTVVERTDAAANLAILSLEPPLDEPAALTLELLARSTYEGTPAEEQYLADKSAKGQRWGEALAHWKRVLELDSSLRRGNEAAIAEAYLNASAAVRQQERVVEAHNLLLEAVDVLPNHGGIRRHLGDSYAGRGEYREAIEQYWLALDLLPRQAAEITATIVRAYRDWGQGLLRQGDFSTAANIFREALQIDSTNGGLLFALGQAEFRRQSFEAAIQAFEAAVIAEPGLRDEVEPYLSKARALMGGPDTAVISFRPGSSRIEVNAVINGRLQLTFVVDTGASMTLIPAWAAEMLGYRAPEASEWMRVQTAGGLRRLPYAALSRLDIQGLGISNLPVLFGDLPGQDTSRGLLGMDFLRHFSMAVDHDLGRMTLRPR